MAFDLKILSWDSADLLLAHCAPALFEGCYCFGLMTCTAEQLFVELLHEEEVVAEARQLGQQDSGLVQRGLLELDDSLVDFERADVDASAGGVWTVGNFQDGE